MYYQHKALRTYDLKLMRLIDAEHLRTPIYGTRRMSACLNLLRHAVSRKRVQRLMRGMGLQAIYPKPFISRPSTGDRIYPYLLRGRVIDLLNQVWV